MKQDVLNPEVWCVHNNTIYIPFLGGIEVKVKFEYISIITFNITKLLLEYIWTGR